VTINLKPKFLLATALTFVGLALFHPGLRCEAADAPAETRPVRDAAQQSPERKPEPQDKDAARRGALLPPDYLVGPEDVLDISVWKNAELSRVVVVRPDGRISLPLTGDLQASGLTPNQLRDEIVRRLKEYQDTVVVSVIVQTVNSHKFYIVGEVRTPGTYPLKARTTVLQAISLAGGLTQYASKNKIVLVRQRNDGTEERLNIRFDDLIYADDKAEYTILSSRNMALRSGDTIFVP
jgi:polysaccharide export outer membrane protein